MFCEKFLLPSDSHLTNLLRKSLILGEQVFECKENKLFCILTFSHGKSGMGSIVFPQLYAKEPSATVEYQKEIMNNFNGTEYNHVIMIYLVSWVSGSRQDKLVCKERKISVISFLNTQINLWKKVCKMSCQIFVSHNSYTINSYFTSIHPLSQYLTINSLFSSFMVLCDLGINMDDFSFFFNCFVTQWMSMGSKSTFNPAYFHCLDKKHKYISNFFCLAPNFMCSTKTTGLKLHKVK